MNCKTQNIHHQHNRKKNHLACEGEIVRGLSGELLGLCISAANESEEGTTKIGGHTGLHAASRSTLALSAD